ncbi:MAG: tRNA 2-thiouridine(34) synthase MnmA [Ruminococcus sp.]|nr:tRNA 2-thiouridine(34) synthase MnmA [Ruminococcus sp.]
MTDNKKVLVAMSGGVDSSVAVKLLADMGYECAGATMQLWSETDTKDARAVAEKLGIDFHVFDLTSQFRHKVIDNFINTYLNGGTPNPCIECNRFLKFQKFLECARSIGYDFIATGHYVKREYNAQTGRWNLKRSPDLKKDQSYVLYSMTQDQIAHTLFPVGELSKTRIRQIAENSYFINADKPDSQDICFIPDGDYAKFITDIVGEQPEGDILLSDGTKLGRHKGLINYTVGQRKGIGVSYSEPLFVIGKNIPDNTLILGTKEKQGCSSLIAENVNFIPFPELTEPIHCTAQTRYHQKDVPCTVYPLQNGEIKVIFDNKHKAVSTGQAVVLYDGEYIIGGGTIIRTFNDSIE